MPSLCKRCHLRAKAAIFVQKMPNLCKRSLFVKKNIFVNRCQLCAKDAFFVKKMPSLCKRCDLCEKDAFFVQKIPSLWERRRRGVSTHRLCEFNVTPTLCPRSQQLRRHAIFEQFSNYFFGFCYFYLKNFLKSEMIFRLCPHSKQVRRHRVSVVNNFADSF